MDCKWDAEDVCVALALAMCLLKFHKMLGQNLNLIAKPFILLEFSCSLETNSICKKFNMAFGSDCVHILDGGQRFVEGF